MNHIKKVLATVAALTLGVGLALTGALSASAHVATVNGSYVCQPDGQYKVKWTVNLGFAPDGSTADVTGTSPAFATQTIDGNSQATFNTFVPGSTTTTSATFNVKWSDNWPDVNGISATGTIFSMPGDCGDTPDSDTITYCHAGGDHYNGITTSTAAFYQSGHIDHADDIFPAGSIVKKGVTHSWAAQGDQSLLQYVDCKLPVVEPLVAKVDFGVTPATCETGEVLVAGEATNATWNADALAAWGTEGPASYDISANANNGAVGDQFVNGVAHFTGTLDGPVASLCPPPAPQECVVLDDWYTEADDLAPVATIDGLVFRGTATPGLAVGYRQPISGNLQGFTGASFDATIEGGADFYYRLVVDLSADGGPAYKSLSFPGTSTITSASIPYQFPGQTLAQLAVAYPNNELRSEGFQISTNSPTTAVATLHGYSSWCADGDFTIPEPKELSGTDTREVQECDLPLDGTATLTIYATDWTQASVPNEDRTGYVLAEKVYGEEYVKSAESVEDETCVELPTPTPTPTDPPGLANTGGSDAGFYLGGGIVTALLILGGVALAVTSRRKVEVASE